MHFSPWGVLRWDPLTWRRSFLPLVSIVRGNDPLPLYLLTVNNSLFAFLIVSTSLSLMGIYSTHCCYSIFWIIGSPYSFSCLIPVTSTTLLWSNDPRFLSELNPPPPLLLVELERTTFPSEQLWGDTDTLAEELEEDLWDWFFRMDLKVVLLAKVAWSESGTMSKRSCLEGILLKVLTRWCRWLSIIKDCIYFY